MTNNHTPTMYSTSHNGGFSKLNYKQLEQKRIRSLSKKRLEKKKKKKKGSIQAGLSYMSINPIPNRDRSRELIDKDLRNHTFTNDMKRALTRKLNPIPRR